jgi:plastocyanin
VAACGSPSSGGQAGSPSGLASAGPGCAALAGLSGDIDDRGAAAAHGQTTTITVGDSFFQPTCLTALPAGSVTLTIRNDGSALHNITVEAQGIDQDVEAGKSITVRVAVVSTAVPYYCKYHRTSGMQGALIPGR